MPQFRLNRCLPGVALAALSGPAAFADGIEIETVSTRSLGTANAGRSATADDASIVFWNPAGMTRLAKPRFTMSLSYINVESLYFDEGSRDLTGAPMRGSTTAESVIGPLVPSMFATMPVGDDLTAGFGISAPFGLGTDYGESWTGRYFATETSALFLNLNPSLAMKIGEHWSVGAGVNFQHAQVSFANMLDFGTIGAGGGLPLKPQGADGRIRLEGDGWGMGWDLGVMYEPCEGTRIGSAYRADIRHRMKSDVDFLVPGPAKPITAGGAFTDTDADIELSVPANWSVSGYHELDRDWAIVADVTWTGWHRTKDLQIEFANPAQPTIEQELDWKNTFRWSVGAIHKLNEDWTLRAGLALTDSPTHVATRDARIPDDDRFWATVGASVRLSETVSLDFAYAYLRFIRPAQFNLDSPLAGHLEGEGHAKPWHTFSIGLNLDF